MSDKILIVDEVPATLALPGEDAGEPLHVECVADAREALARLSAGETFAVVVADYERPGRQGAELLRWLESESPQTVPVLLTGRVELDVAIDALHHGSVFRFLERPCPRDTLRGALRAALDEHRERVAQAELRGRLDFTTQVLVHFNEELDQRLNRQSASLAQLLRFVSELGRAGSLPEIAEQAALACAAACPGRGALVELWTDVEQHERVRAFAAEGPGERRHVRPIETPEGQRGMLVVDACDPQGRRLSRDERGLLAAIASTSAVAVHNEARRHERDEAQHATFLALAKLAEQRDNETGKHLERVSLYCQLIAEGLRLLPELRAPVDERFVRDLMRSAPLHDIGKVGIPDAILLKPGKLDRDEWEVMKTHTTIGARTLDSVVLGGRGQGFLEMSRDIAWCHHERWDGRGYPRGLAGEAIPLSARILTVADVYDALTSVRPYKDAWSHEDSLRALVEGSGTLFDPRLVQVFVERRREADEVRARLADRAEDLELSLPAVTEPSA